MDVWTCCVVVVGGGGGGGGGGVGGGSVCIDVGSDGGGGREGDESLEMVEYTTTASNAPSKVPTTNNPAVLPVLVTRTVCMASNAPKVPLPVSLFAGPGVTSAIENSLSDGSPFCGFWVYMDAICYVSFNPRPCRPLQTLSLWLWIYLSPRQWPVAARSRASEYTAAALLMLAIRNTPVVFEYSCILDLVSSTAVVPLETF